MFLREIVWPSCEIQWFPIMSTSSNATFMPTFVLISSSSNVTRGKYNRWCCTQEWTSLNDHFFVKRFSIILYWFCKFNGVSFKLLIPLLKGWRNTNCQINCQINKLYLNWFDAWIVEVVRRTQFKYSLAFSTVGGTDWKQKKLILLRLSILYQIYSTTRKCYKN